MHLSMHKSSSSASLPHTSSSGSLSSAYSMYELADGLASTAEADPSLGLPSFDALNPYARRATRGKGHHDEAHGGRYQPVPGLQHSKESLYFRRGVGQILKRVHEEISPAELEVRANTPEFKIHEDDWVAHNEKNQFALITPLKTVARIPASLLMVTDDQAHSRHTHENDISGYLRKRGERNRSYKRRYMELNGHILSYYKKKPEKNGIPLSREDKKAYERGSIDLDRVSSIQPIDLKTEPFGIHLVTTSRTWAIAAESEQDYQRWLKSLCAIVKFSAVHVTFKRMLLLQEVSSKAVTDVRMVIATGDTVGEIVEHIFNCYKMALDAAPLRPYDPTKYVLKVTGYRDFMIDRFRVMNEYMHVRDCLLSKKTLRLTVVHESVIQETALRSLSIRTDLPLSNAFSNQFEFFASGGETDRSSLQMTTLSEDFDRSSGGSSSSSTLPSGTVHEPFAIKIRRVLNIPRFTCVRKRSSEEASIEQRPLTTSSVIVRIELFDGGELLENAQYETTDVRLRAQRDNLLYAEWPEPLWHHFNIDVSDVVRSMRIQLTLIGVKRVIGSKEVDGREEKILVTGVNAFEVDGMLTQGTQYVAMLNNLHSCSQGPVPHIVHPEEALIHVEFPRFQAPIKFDWSESEHSQEMNRYARRTVVGSAKSQQIRKVGWLQKLGFSKWTKWRRRWFELDQGSCSLSYAEDESAPKKHIPLKYCSVMVADEMNEKYTTCPVNKGTRKERQTWCFKVRPQNSSRDYIISAETKQEREEWMLAIHALSKGDLDGDSFIREKFDPIAEDESRYGDNNADEADGRNILESFAQERRDSIARTSDTSTSLKDNTIAELRRVILMDPLYRLGPYQKSQMWAHREEFMEIPAALPRILSCVDWTDREEVEEALELLPKWAIPDHPAAYIELLNGEFANETVRSFAVGKIGQMRDTTFSYFLPQLVQALKFENHHMSPLASLLIERAIKNPNQIGFDLFWSMKVESHNPQYRERYGLILNTYLDVCSHKMRAILKLQDKLFSADGMFDRICQSVKAKKKEGSDEMKRVMREGLEALNEILPPSFQLPIDPRIEVGKIIVSKCRVMDSAKKPLWLVFENAEEGGDPVTVIFKAGDDVRQDCLTLQLIRLMDEMWRDEGLDLAMEPYKCVATSPMTGILEVVKNSVTTADVHKRVGILGAFKDPSFSNWISANNADRRSHKAAVDLFSRSCAGYCVATCVLGIGDRHNDNIMICASGRYFHIDFGHFLGHFKYQMGVRRERTPFVFTREMAHVLGGVDSKEFHQFVNTCCNAYNVVRKHMHLLVALLLLMVPADMPELTGRDDINHLVTMLGPELTEEQASSSFTDAIYFCLDNKFKRFDNTIHILAHVLG